MWLARLGSNGESVVWVCRPEVTGSPFHSRAAFREFPWSAACTTPSNPQLPEVIFGVTKPKALRP